MYQAPRGTSDILPEEQPYWQYIKQVAADITRLYGYQRIDSPTFEETSLFTRSVGEGTDIVEKEMYTFDDKGGKSLTLRPEGTASVCRAYIQHGMQNQPQPVKLYYISSIFRYERPQAGRLREHHQFGCEAIGDADAAVDAELIEMAWRFYTSLGLRNLTLSLNSIGCPDCRPRHLEALKTYYSAREDALCPDCRVRLVKNPLRLVDCKQPSCQPLADAAPTTIAYLCDACAEHFSQLKSYLQLLDVPFTVNPRIVRGFDYYTRTVFEIQPQEEGGQTSIGGGGRYDNLITELGGKPAPAVGFGAGIERIILNLKKQGVTVPQAPAAEVLMAYLGETARDAAFKLAADLRNAGIAAVFVPGGRSLKAQLRQANSLDVRSVAIIGEDEVTAGTVTLRHMADARQETVPAADLVSHLTSGNV